MCNAVYAFMTEWMTAKEREDFDRRLDAVDSSMTPKSHGTKELFALMGVRPPRPPEAGS